MMEAGSSPCKVRAGEDYYVTGCRWEDVQIEIITAMENATARLSKLNVFFSECLRCETLKSGSFLLFLQHAKKLLGRADRPGQVPR